MQTTDYEQQAQAFLDRFGIKFRATLSDSKVAPWSASEHSLCGSRAEKSRHHYRVTLSRGGTDSNGSSGSRLVNTFKSRLTFDFFGSIADAEKGIKTVTAYDVLACISGDVHCADTFKEFCGEFGESEDSIKALQTWRRCSAFSKRLKAFFTSGEIEALVDLK